MTKILVLVTISGAALAAAATAAAPTLTLAASAPSVDYGKPVVLSGALSTQKANQSISLKSTECGTTKAVKTATVKTAAAGAYTTTSTPIAGTSYQVTYKNATSPVVAVTVRPLLQLIRVARGSYTAKVTVGRSLKGKAVLFQRYSRLRKRWVQVKRLILATETVGPATKPVVVDSVSFRAKVPAKTRVRMLITAAQAGPCYLSASSTVLRA
jgi:hypothetical protein